eukprot:2512024-Alexandrium_andersonii.AAC.1
MAPWGGQEGSSRGGHAARIPTELPAGRTAHGEARDFIGRNSELGAQNPARGGGGPSAPNGSTGPLRGSESAKVGDPPAALPGAGGAARSV